MVKKYVVRLTDAERATLADVVKKLKGTGQRVRRVQILLKAGADGPAWTDARIAESFGCRTKTVENVRHSLVERGSRLTKRATPPTPKLLDGKQKAQVIATRLGPPLAGFANGSLKLLARRVVELGIVDAISHETVRRTLNKVGGRRRVRGRHGAGSRHVRTAVRRGLPGAVY